MMRATATPFTKNISITLGLFYVTGFVIVLFAIGPWEAVRQFAAEGVILALWLWSAHKLLGDALIEVIPIKRPALELGLGLGSFLLLFIGAAGRYLGIKWLSFFIVVFLLPVVVFVALRYDRRAVGLINASRRAWLAVLAIVVINIAVGIVAGQLLPPGELPTPPGADLAEGIRGPLDVLLILGQLVLVAAIPEELFFRVYLQTRLERYLPLGWAIVAQALLFNAAHFPQHVIRFGYSWPLALAGLLPITNGLIGGYLWLRTRSFPLLVVLHLFAYPRFGL